MGWLKRFWGLIGKAIAALRRTIAGRPSPGGLARVAIRLLLAIGLILATVGLWWINHILHLPDILWTPPGLLAWLAEIWLPLLFLLAVALLLLGRRLWRLLGPEPLSGAFPDLDLAWAEALSALDQAGIDPTTLPIFLIVGRPASGDRTFLGAGERPLRVRQVPNRPDAPMHVSADAEGIYVAIPGASMIGRQAERLADRAAARRSALAREPAGIEARPRSLSVPPSSSTVVTAPTYHPTMSDLPTLGAPADEAIETAPAPRIVEGPDTRRIDEEEASSFEVSAMDDDEVTAAPPAILPSSSPGLRDEEAERHESLLRDPDELERLEARLRHACRLIAAARRPYCPINGVALLLPMAATDTDSDTRDTASLCHRELETIREVLQLEHPIFAVVCDLETLPGFRDFLARIPEETRRMALGRSFPLVPDLSASERLDLIERGAKWLGHVLLPSLVYDLLRVDADADAPPGTEGRSLDGGANVRLFRLLLEFQRRQNRIGRLLTRGVVLQSRHPVMLGGCYLAGTGFDPRREQGFVPGLFRLLVEHQNYVAWSPRMRSEEERFRRLTSRGYALLAVSIVALAGFIAWLLFEG